jgi:hypothetical protein
MPKILKYLKLLVQFIKIAFQQVRFIWKVSELHHPIITIFGGSRLKKDNKFARIKKWVKNNSKTIIMVGGTAVCACLIYYLLKNKFLYANNLVNSPTKTDLIVEREELDQTTQQQTKNSPRDFTEPGIDFMPNKASTKQPIKYVELNKKIPEDELIVEKK